MPLWGVQSLAATAAAGVRSHKSVSACRRVCVTATCLNALHYSTSHRPPPPFSSQSHSVTFPPFSLFFIICHASLCGCTEYRWAYIFLCLPHMYMLPLGRASDGASDLVCISQRGGRTGFGLFVNIRNEIRCLGRPSLKIGITQPCARINLGYIPPYLTDRGAYPFPIAFNLSWIKTKVFSILIKDFFFFSPSCSNPNTGIIRFLHSWLINLLIMHGSESKAHWCICVSSSSSSSPLSALVLPCHPDKRVEL